MRFHVSGSCCSKDETLCSERRFFDTSEQATIDDDWHMEGDKSKSKPWIGENTTHPAQQQSTSRYMWVQGRLTKKQVTTRPGNIWPEEWSNMSKGSQRKTKNEWVERKPKLEAARDQRRIYSILDNDLGHEVIIDNAKRKLEIRRASAMPGKVAKPANPNGGGLVQVSGPRCKSKKPNSSRSRQDHENLIVDSQMIRITESTPKTHGDHIEDGGHVSMSRYNVLHEPISFP